MNKNFEILTNKDIEPDEFAKLMASVGWGQEEDYDSQKIVNSITSYPFVAHVRNEENELIGYVSSFSDGAFSTFIGELVVKPEYQKKGLGRELLNAVEQKFEGAPVYIISYETEKEFFLGQGFKQPKTPMFALTKRTKKSVCVSG